MSKIKHREIKIFFNLETKIINCYIPVKIVGDSFLAVGDLHKKLIRKFSKIMPFAILLENKSFF